MSQSVHVILCCVAQFFQAMYSYETNKVYRALKDLNNHSIHYTKVRMVSRYDRAFQSHFCIQLMNTGRQGSSGMNEQTVLLPLA